MVTPEMKRVALARIKEDPTFERENAIYVNDLIEEVVLRVLRWHLERYLEHDFHLGEMFHEQVSIPRERFIECMAHLVADERREQQSA
ncbi:MAG: hypothetical protein AAFZ18_13315 [Myxococcota bacterium]